jgi:hypothetical protein
MRRQRHAKIVATVGPASASPDMLRELFLAGVDTFRLNFSHGTHEDHAAVHAAIRALEKDVGHPIGILQDLQGPKIRIGTLKDGALALSEGETIRFVLEGKEGDRTSIPLPHPEIFEAIAPGQDLLIDDGRVSPRDGLIACTSRLHWEGHLPCGADRHGPRRIEGLPRPSGRDREPSPSRHGHPTRAPATPGSSHREGSHGKGMPRTRGRS